MHLIGDMREDGLANTSGWTTFDCTTAVAALPGRNKRAAITMFVRNVWYAPA